jgi:hypothetical protein
MSTDKVFESTAGDETSANPAQNEAKTSKRDEDLAWAKKRALEYLNRGDKKGALASFMSDTNKTAIYKAGDAASMLMVMAMMNCDMMVDKAFIEGFN